MQSVVTIDCRYMGLPRFAAAYLLVSEGRAAFIDNNTSYAVPGMLAALHDAGLAPEDVAYVIITHVHLDHAGGSSALMRACPRATLLAHPRAAPHVVDPTRLVRSASQVYGAARFRELYGEIEPIPESRVRVMADEERLRFGDRELTFLHTRGHANHHFCVHDAGADAVFSGDAFGLVYPHLQAGGLFAFASTSPTDFLEEEAKAAVARLVDTGARRVFPTHFGEVTEVRDAAKQLIEHLEFSGGLEREAAAADVPDEELAAFCEPRLRAWFEEQVRRRPGLERVPDLFTWLEMDLDLNAQGLAHAAKRRRRKAREA